MNDNNNNSISESDYKPKDYNFKNHNKGMYFIDGIRRIDFVLVYQKTNNNKTNEMKRFTFLKSLIKSGLEIEIQDDKGYYNPKINENKLLQFGNYELKNSYQCNLVFIKIYASWDTICRYADIMKIRKPLLTIPSNKDTKSEYKYKNFLKKLDVFNIFYKKENELPQLERGFTYPFSKSKLHLFDIPKDNSTFFSNTERSLIVNYILRRASYQYNSITEHQDNQVLEVLLTNDIELNQISNCKCSTDFSEPDNLENDTETLIKNKTFGIAKLLADGVFDSAYVLHESQLIEENNSSCKSDNQRQLLDKNWVTIYNLFKEQPLDHIRLYYGEKIAFYFAWLGFYTFWLLPISILGTFIAIYNLLYARTDIFLQDIKNSYNITMCPLTCSDKLCQFWVLREGYHRYFIVRLLDNKQTVFLAIITSIWASLFLEMWKRKQNRLAYKWNVHDMETEIEPARPEFISLLDKTFPRKPNQITRKLEPFVPFWRKRVPIMFFTYSTVLFTIVMALALIAGIILYDLLILPLLRNSTNMSLSQSTIITSTTASILYFIIILTLTSVYSRIAVWLTDIEHHRTQSEYDNSVTLKLYLLQFINNYSYIFYVGFIQQYTQPIPKPYGTLKSLLNPRGCSVGGCLLDVSIQLMIIMVGTQIFSHITEYSTPRLMSWINKLILERSNKQNKTIETNPSDIKVTNIDHEDCATISPELSRCISDNILSDPGPRPLFYEYLEMLIQFGFITMFIPAFPIGPLLALFNNLFEIRSDALKYVRYLRRPVAQRVKDIGIWLSILSIVSQIAVRSNAVLIAFGTTYVDRLVYKMVYSTDGTLEGFLKFSMSSMNSSEFNNYSSNNINSTYCNYIGYRYSPIGDNYKEYTSVFWQILTFKVIFVCVFVNLVSLFMAVISVMIPDIPESLRFNMKAETYWTNEIILKPETILNAKKDKSNQQRNVRNRKVPQLNLLSNI